MQEARQKLANAHALADDTARESDALKREEGKATLEKYRAEIKQLTAAAQIEEKRSWTPFACGVSWLASVLSAGLWADAHVSETDRWCHAGRQVFLAPAAAALPHMNACKNMVGVLVKAIRPGLWSVKFGMLGIRQCRTGKQEMEEKVVFDLYYLQSAHSLAAETVAASKPVWARNFIKTNGFPHETTRCDDVVGPHVQGTGTGKKLTLRDALLADHTTLGMSAWLSQDVEDLVLESDEACRTGTYVMLSHAAEPEHQEWIGMVGVLCKRTRIGQWLVRFPRESLDRLVSHAILNTGLLNKFDLVYADSRMTRILVESKRNFAIQRQQRIDDMKFSKSDTLKKEGRPLGDAAGLGSSGAMLNVLNEVVVLMFRVASQVSFASIVGLFSCYNRSLSRCDAACLE